MLGLGIDIFKNKATSGFSFTDVDAKAYYNALATANGGDIDSNSLYGISLSVFKQEIDDLFISLKVDSTYSKITRMYLFLGGTAATHAINAINATPELTYVGSPTHDATGMVLNGTTQYASMNNDPSSDCATDDDAHISFWGITSTTNGLIGSFDTGRLYIFATSPSGTLYVAPSNDSGARVSETGTTYYDKLLIASRTSNTLLTAYKDGTSVGTAGAANTYVLPTSPSFIGQVSSSGTPLTGEYFDGNVQFSSIGDGISSTQASTLNSAVTTLNTALGR